MEASPVTSQQCWQTRNKGIAHQQQMNNPGVGSRHGYGSRYVFSFEYQISVPAKNIGQSQTPVGIYLHQQNCRKAVSRQRGRGHKIQTFLYPPTKGQRFGYRRVV